MATAACDLVAATSVDDAATHASMPGVRVLLPLLLLASPVVAHAQPVLVDRIVATIDARTITRSELDARAERSKTSREAALDELIAEHLIAKDALARSITVSDEEVDRAVQMVIEQNKLSREEFLRALELQHYTLDAYRTAIGLQLLELRWLSLRTASMDKPTDDAARASFLADQRKRLVAELKAKAALEVRP